NAGYVMVAPTAQFGTCRPSPLPGGDTPGATAPLPRPENADSNVTDGRDERSSRRSRARTTSTAASPARAAGCDITSAGEAASASGSAANPADGSTRVAGAPTAFASAARERSAVWTA